jgi:hypothetical protein
VLEDDAGEQCVPHRPHRVVIAPVPAHDLQVLHQALVGEMINDKLEPAEIAARVDRVPGKQVLLSNGHRGISSLRVVSTTTMIPWWPPFFTPAWRWGEFPPPRPSVMRKSLIVRSPLG